ncbi:V(D)J recombination-activating protein 1-like [Ruditapes philippinarum]|uniref:V(D)J recombination-activating protein 1-like n=1 Tax=Ruditapes philippinarum TaxID=129788 RepID=UPI00295B8571|nr:V(D)J recombination-activating protein 1-like [Ruditapes philippinarum]
MTEDPALLLKTYIKDGADGMGDVSVHWEKKQERCYLKGKILRIYTKDGWRRHEIAFFTSMIDEKFDRSESGLAGSGSSYICTLCEATRETAKSELGLFNVTRTYKQTKEIDDYIKINPDNLSQAKLDQIYVGVKQVPIICADAIEKGIDSTHADINMASFSKKLIVREIVGISIWEMQADIKVLLLETEFDRHMRLKTGINPALMMPGNYARTVFDVKNEHIVCELIESVEEEI